MSSPLSRIWPPSGSARRATRRSRVLLRQPDGRRSERNSRGAASSDTWSTATTSPKAFRSRRTASAGAPAPVTAGAAPAPGPRSPGDLAPPALRPLGELLGDEVRVGEVHPLHDVTVGHELGEIRRELDRLVAGPGVLRLGEAE